MADTVVEQPALKADEPMSGMSHSEVHYFNSYNHHGIHEEMLVSVLEDSAEYKNE